uniref:Uncharacterized protein n=1 Tax=Arundo donax TaxID=35708 RepID=A0A0A9CG72_ARUDO
MVLAKHLHEVIIFFSSSIPILTTMSPVCADEFHSNCRIYNLQICLCMFQ